MEICNKEICTGCMSCMNICPKNAIDVKQDEKGFYIPFIDTNNCIKCNKCKKTCPSLNQVAKNYEINEVWACWQKDDNIRKSSTSGGVFTALAKNVIKDGGVVFGVAIDENYIAKHIEVTKVDELEKLRGSKYVQSDINLIYRKVEKRLIEGLIVLFTGVPWQIAGLKNFLSLDYQNLITVDILCHGASSPMFFSQYLKEKSNNHTKKISKINFRYKKPSWTEYSMRIDFENGEKYIKSKYEDPYLIAFLNDYILRDCCTSCLYTDAKRVSDITLADFWGYKSESQKYRNDEKGISLILVNSLKGKREFKQISDDIIKTAKTIQEASVENKSLTKPATKNKDEKEFWKDFLSDDGYEKVEKKYLYSRRAGLKRNIDLFIYRNNYLVPKFLIKKINN